MFCADISSPVYFIFSSETPALLYYSHIPTAIAALILSLFVFWKKRNSATISLLTISILFGVWNFVDLVLWTGVDSRIIMVFWSSLYLLQALILTFAWHFSVVFLKGNEGLLKQEMLLGLFLLPLIVLLPTHWNLSGFDLANCEAQQGPFVRYFYFFQGAALLWILGGLLRTYSFAKGSIERKKVAIFSLGMFLFLLSFSWGNLFGSLTLRWEFEQYGLFGMPLFIGLLSFLIVRYNAFDIKLLGAQALVVMLAILVGSQLFFIKSATNIALTSITLFLVLVFGFFLIRSVKREVRQKEELQTITDHLAAVNGQLKKLDNAKSEFISIASHQLRTPLTAIKGYVSLLLEGAYGPVSAELQDVLNKIYVTNGRLSQLVENMLNISRIESGRVQYQFADIRVEPILNELKDMFSMTVEGRGLEIRFELPGTPLPRVSGDSGKLREVFSNLIDNAIKYTERGSITVSAGKHDAFVEVRVKDTGIGIDPEEVKTLFKKFTRGKDSGKINVSGTGLGLYVVKQFIEAHRGTVHIESEGKGKGTTFVVRLPIKG